VEQNLNHVVSDWGIKTMTTEQISYYTNVASFGIVIALWIVLVWTLIVRRKSDASPHASHERRSWIGFILQIASFPIAGMAMRTPLFSPFISGQYGLNIFVQLLAIILIIASVLFEVSAFRELGRQWSLQARVLEGHKLVKTGAYAIVRHPIYTALLGRLLATGFTISHWSAILIAVIVFFIGTRIRTISEERLLREAFVDEFDSWKARVPALIPFTKF
jgi:protein-S-isoprenylcysteine O-methyltransferase Ste14